jgi:uncharacterized Ntn-hydrolase superfamily protein
MRRTLLFLCVVAVAAAAHSESARRPVATYSIVARDPGTGEMGVAVQSHWFSVGSLVSWAEAGVGAVATQSFVEVSYGPLGLELMRAGKSASEALSALLAVDPHAEVRQVAMVDASGEVAVHTGAKCIREAGHRRGAGYSVQANLMADDTVPDAMAAAFERASGDLAARLVAALEAAEAEGGDIRGRQSAAILVVPGEPSGAPWRARTIDLRVEDHPAPLAELGRLLAVKRVYAHMDTGDARFAEGDIEGALAEYAAAAEKSPDNREIRYWQAVTMVGAGRIEDALPVFAAVFAGAEGDRWRRLTPRLAASGLLPDDPELTRRILQAQP